MHDIGKGRAVSDVRGRSEDVVGVRVAGLSSDDGFPSFSAPCLVMISPEFLKIHFLLFFRF